ncbi:MAG: DUF2490 domain-containing protein [Planctomycetota bacterium]|jgi:hypothetical protein
MKQRRTNRLSKATAYIITAAICGTLLSRPCFAFDDQGFQFWNITKASFDINKDWKAEVEEELRFGDEGGTLYYHHTDLGFVYRSLAEWVDVGFNYRQVFQKDSERKWKREDRPHLNVTLKAEALDLDLSSRSRFEYRNREDQEDFWVYRNKVTVQFPWALTDLKLRPYVAEEIFVILDPMDYLGDRLYGGMYLDISENMRADFYYVWQSKRLGDPQEVHALGVALKFRF